MLLTPDQKLIHSILQGGIKAYYQARRLGVREEILFDEAKSIWQLMEKLAAKGRLPSLPEIRLSTGHHIELCEDPLDIELVSEFIVKRGLTAQLHDKLAPLVNPSNINQDPFGTRDQLSDVIADTAWSYGEPYSINSRSSLTELMESYERAESSGSGLLGLSSPWETVDSASLGLQPGELTVVYAKRKVGKSWITVVWAVHMWRNDLQPGEKVLFVTMEMTPLQVLKRMACTDLRLDAEAFRKGRLTTAEKKKLQDWVEERMATPPSESNLIIAGSNQVRTVKDIAALVGEHRPKVVVVDSFYILGRAEGASIYERVLANVQGLKLDIALKYEVPVLASTQLKGTTNKEVLTADSDDAMGAKAIGDYADVTRGLFVNSLLKSRNERLFRGMEAREFVSKDVRINFDFATMDFSEIAEIDPDSDGLEGIDGNEDGDAEPKVGDTVRRQATRGPAPVVPKDDPSPDIFV